MKITIRAVNAIKLCIYACVFINTDVILFFNSNLNSPFTLTNVLILLSLLLLIGIKNKPQQYMEIIQECVKPIGVLLLFLTIEFAYSVIRYSQTPMEVILCMTHFPYLLLVFPIMYIFITEGYTRIMTGISFFVSVVIFLRVLQAVVYNAFGIVLFPALIKMGASGTRFGRIRFGTTCLGSLATIFLFYMIIKEKKRGLYLACWVVNLFAYVYMLQSRIALAVIILVLAYMYVYRNKQTLKNMLFIFAVVLLSIYLISVGFAEEAIESFDPDSDMGGGSTLARIYAIEHYYNSPYRNKLLGMGFINDNDLERSLILHRTRRSMRAFFSDLGLLGYYFNMGVIGIVIYLYFFLFLYFRSVKKRGLRASPEQMLVKGLFVFYLLASTTILPLFPKQIFQMPFIWGIAEYLRIKKKDEEKDLTKE